MRSRGTIVDDRVQAVLASRLSTKKAVPGHESWRRAHRLRYADRAFAVTPGDRPSGS
jgi:hypothetical protein